VDPGSFDWHEAGLTVGQVAERSGVAASALRFYERQGLISSDRTSGNQRRYHGDVLCRVAMIRACQRVGLSIAEIKTALAQLPEGQVPGPEDWQRLSERLEHELHDRIGDLNRALQALQQGTTQATAPARAPSADPQRTGRTPAQVVNRPDDQAS
jgi:MerR family transcriptional regulator, redox-sensitive transcriptional activator SoxR